MIIVGIDPGSRKTGYGIIEKVANQSRYIHSGFIRLNEKQHLALRLVELQKQLHRILEEYRPDCGVVEKIFFARNAQSALTLGHARGVILCALAANQIPIHEYTPSEIKQSLVGAGRASKDQVQYMVKLLLNQKQKQMNEDESDALAMAITHSHFSQIPKNAYIRS